MSYTTPKICIKCKYRKHEYIKDNVYMSTCTAEECPMIKRKVVVNDDTDRKVIENM